MRVLEAPRWWDLENLGPGAHSSLTAKGIPAGFPQRVQPKANISTLHSSAQQASVASVLLGKLWGKLWGWEVS